MANRGAIAGRAIQKSVDRFLAYVQRMDDLAAERDRSQQREERRAYEDAIFSDDFEIAYQDFMNRYGEDAWERQRELAVRRARREVE